ncbi:MAG: hypothetical protein IAA25_07495 [Candidatus Ruminococcus intestinipullorum]|nr:hypothetical protein [Candidatus Ruminococcus intestinipullorum]
MIDKKLIPVAGLKREPFSGNHGGMRYYFCVDESKENFLVFVYPEPWCFEQTPEEEKESRSFPLNEEGMDLAIEWLFQKYEEKKEIWEQAAQNTMHN